ncbi:MAG: DNA recombination protein RmuC [Gammaproteobacteria bacterium]|nr:MAG: DNA recombination protein RmuC [Gammaproteobacteria bacterium]
MYMSGVFMPENLLQHPQLLLALIIPALVLLFVMIWLLSQFRQFKLQLHNELIQQQGEAREKQLGQLAEMQQQISRQLSDIQQQQERRLGEVSNQLGERLGQFNESTQNTLYSHRQQFEERQLKTFQMQQENMAKGMAEVRQQVTDALGRYAEEMGKRVEALTQTTDQRLKEISGQVEKRLNEGFEKTTATFADVLKRLALIDEAQKRITELSGNVVSLQEVLADKRSRGAFGEVQLNALVRNVMPENSFEFQYSLPNNARVDCMLFLPEPTGNIGIDSKFPLESFRNITNIHLGDMERQAAERQFRQDIKKHIKDIADKYILPGTTSDGAVMFIPAEAVFAEIHAHYYDLVEEAQRARVWMVSPTTLMAVLTTARAVLKDSATRKQVHIIQEHLMALSKDFERFRKRMDDLSTHIRQAHKDVEQVHTSAKKISSRFEKIEKVEVIEETPVNLLGHEDD